MLNILQPNIKDILSVDRRMWEKEGNSIDRHVNNTYPVISFNSCFLFYYNFLL